MANNATCSCEDFNFCDLKLISPKKTILITKGSNGIFKLDVNFSEVNQFLTEDTLSVNLTGNGQPGSPLRADVIIDPAGNNLLSLTANGLFVNGAIISQGLQSVITVDPVLTTDNDIDLNGTVFSMSKDGDSFLLIDSTPTTQIFRGRAIYNDAGITNQAGITGSSNVTTATAVLSADYDAAKTAIITGTATASTATFLYSADVHSFDGAIELLNIPATVTSFVLFYDTTTKRVTYGAAPVSGNVYAVLNGLHESPAGTFKLGGALTETTTITSTGFDFTVTGADAFTIGGGSLIVENTGAGSALRVKADTGYGVRATSTSGDAAVQGYSANNKGVRGDTDDGFGVQGGASASGIGVDGYSDSGIAGRLISNTGTGVVAQSSTSYGADILSGFTVAPGTILNVLRVNRTANVPGTTGTGGAIVFNLINSFGEEVSNRLISKWTDATNGAEDSEFYIEGINNGATQTIFTLAGSGRTTLNLYGSGTFNTGVALYGLAVDASGNIMEVALGGGGALTDGDKGDITVSGAGAVWTIDNDTVTYGQIQNVVADDVFLGRISGAGGDIEELTGTQATTLLNAFTNVLKGLAPASGGGTVNFLRADGSWAAPVALLADADYGDITVSGGSTVLTIDANVVTYAKMQDVSATNRFLGRITAGAGDTEELTGTQATTLLDIFSSSLKGLVPSSGGGSVNFLRADGTWAVPTDTSGITSLNGLSGASQTFAMGTTAQSNDLGWVSSGTIHTLHVPDASASNRGVVTTGTQSFAGAKTFNAGATFASTISVTGFSNLTAGLATNSTAGNANFYVTGGITANRTTTAAYLVEAAAGIGLRAGFNGSTAYTMTANDAYATVVIASTSITEAGSGTHPLIAGLVVRAPIVSGGAGATANMATIYIDAAPSGVTPTGGSYALWVKAGQTKLGGGLDLDTSLITGYAATYRNEVGTTYSLVASDTGKIITFNNGSAITLTVPAGLPTGFSCSIVQLGAGQVTFTASGTTINNRQSFTKTAGQYAVASITMYTSNTFATGGDMAA